MVTVKLTAIRKPGVFEQSTQNVSVSLQYFGDKAGVKVWKNKLSEEMPEGLDLQNMIAWCEQFFAENEFWPGAISQTERVWFLPNKRFFLSKSK